MNWRNITVYFIFGTLGLIGLYDVLVITQSGKENSVSQVMIDLSYQYPSFTFLIGFAMGHLFWRMGDKKKAA